MMLDICAPVIHAHDQAWDDGLPPGPLPNNHNPGEREDSIMRMTRSVVALCIAVFGVIAAPATAQAAPAAHTAIYWWKG